MKNVIKLFLVLTLFSAVLFTGCKTTQEEANEFLTLKTYLSDNGMDLGSIIVNNSGQKFVIAAKTGSELDDRFLIDIRSGDAFSTSHIEGAKNYALSDVLSACAEAQTAGKDPVIICYTGQTACFATALCRLAGYTSTQALKWGMSSWSSETDSWSGNVKNIAESSANWSTDAASALQAYTFPVVVTGKEGGEAILEARVNEVLADGFGAAAISASDVLDNPDSYFINNYFSEGHYLGFGHISGAARIQPLSLSNIDNLDPSKTVVTYCYTGQTSAVITAYLRVLGYEAKSLKFGMNGLYNANPFWTSDIGNQWGYDSNSNDFPLVN